MEDKARELRGNLGVKRIKDKRRNDHTISERLYGRDKEWEPIEISQTDPDYSEKMSRYGAEGYQEYNYNRTTGRHYLRKEKNCW